MILDSHSVGVFWCSAGGRVTVSFGGHSCQADRGQTPFAYHTCQHAAGGRWCAGIGDKSIAGLASWSHVDGKSANDLFSFRCAKLRQAGAIVAQPGPLNTSSLSLSCTLGRRTRRNSSPSTPCLTWVFLCSRLSQADVVAFGHSVVYRSRGCGQAIVFVLNWMTSPLIRRRLKWWRKNMIHHRMQVVTLSQFFYIFNSQWGCHSSCVEVRGFVRYVT
jgi:hypothetical protein